MDKSARPLMIDLNNLISAKRIIRSIQRDCRAALKALAILEDWSSNNKEEEDADKRQRRTD